MKKTYISIIAAVSVTLASCADFTEIDPKGENILSTAQELDLLFNYDYLINTTDVQTMCGDMLYNDGAKSIIDLINNPARSKASIALTWDQEGHDEELADLTSSDALYNDCYALINKVANPALARVDNVTGDASLKNRIRCEALTMRALFHFIAVQKFAKAYDPAYASTTPAIPYCLEYDDLLTPQPQRTLEYVYSHIISDLDRAIELDGLPEKSINHFRLNKPSAHAVKAMALMCMQNYSAAAEEAKKALEINPQVSDYNSMLTGASEMLKMPLLVRPKLESVEDYYESTWIEIYTYSKGAIDALEDGHVLRTSFSSWDKKFDGIFAMLLPADTYGVTNAVKNLDGDSNWNGIGLKTTHMYLILAEAALHDNDIDTAMDNLDKIRVNRIPATLYQPLKGAVTEMDEAIAKVKQTSYGENIFSYYNFVNKKRWTRVDGYKETLKRTIKGASFEGTYTLSPESSLWVFPFGQDVISANSNIHQNY